MKNTAEQKHEYCPIEESSKLIGDFWSLMIIRRLLDGKLRFNELEEMLDNVTGSTLSSKLKRLIEQGLVERTQYQCIPPKVEYSLTAKGLDLKPLIAEVESFGRKWLERQS